MSRSGVYILLVLSSFLGATGCRSLEIAGRERAWGPPEAGTALLFPTAPTVAMGVEFAARSDWPSFTEKQDLGESVEFREYYLDRQSTFPQFDRLDRTFQFLRTGRGRR